MTGSCLLMISDQTLLQMATRWALLLSLRSRCKASSSLLNRYLSFSLMKEALLGKPVPGMGMLVMGAVGADWWLETAL